MSHVIREFQNVICTKLADPTLRKLRHRGRSGFSPSLSYGRHFGPPSVTAKQAAVMIAIEPREAVWSIPLTVRPNQLPDHPGQISLPGGRLEGQESHLEAAHREFAEELGATLTGRVVGELQPIYVFNSDYYVRPFVAVCDQQLNYRPCRQEVERVIHLPLNVLRDATLHSQRCFSRGLMHWRARVISYGNDLIWGATAVILGELAVVLQDARLPDPRLLPGSDSISDESRAH